MVNKVARLLLVLWLLLGAVLPVLAQGNVSGSVLADNAAPTITSVTLQAANKTDATNSMDPLTEYVVQIIAADTNTIDDIVQIDIVLFHDSDGGQDGDGAAALAAGFDCDEIAVYKWLKAGSTWSMEDGGVSTTWTLEGNNDTPASMAVTESEWNLSFVPGKLAVEAPASGGATGEWDIYVKVTDVTAATAEATLYTKAMTAYSAITMSDATVSFGTMALGSTAAIQTPVDHIITTQVIANDTHALSINTTATWTTGSKTIALDVSGTPDAAGEFGLKIDDADGGAGHPATPQAVTTGATTITDHGTDGRTQTTSGGSEATSDVDFYMDLTLASSGIDIGTYTGTITFQVTNS